MSLKVDSNDFRNPNLLLSRFYFSNKIEANRIESTRSVFDAFMGALALGTLLISSASKNRACGGGRCVICMKIRRVMSLFDCLGLSCNLSLSCTSASLVPQMAERNHHRY